MRPQSIVNFERAVLAGLALGLVNTALTWNQINATAADAGMGTGFLVSIQAVTIVVTLLLLWFIARKASPVAKWIYVVITVLGLIGGLFSVSTLLEGGVVSVAIVAVQYLLSIASLWFLFRPDATAWFNDGRGDA